MSTRGLGWGGLFFLGFIGEGIADLFEDGELVFFGFLFGGFFFVVFFVEFIDDANHEEDDEGDDEEVDEVLEEVAVADVGGFGGAKEVGDDDFEIGEVYSADDEADEGHDDVVDEAGDDLGEGAADDDTYG